MVTPQYAPSLILGRIIVQNQQVEYVDAAQKHFAWTIEFILALTMFFIVVVFDVRSVVNLFVCILCLTLLFFKTAFGICLGCIMYNKVTRQKAQYCPGGVCKVIKKEPCQNVNAIQLCVLVGVILLLGALVIVNPFGWY